MKALKFPIIFITVFVILGIIAGNFYNLSFVSLFVINLSTLLILLLINWFASRKISFDKYFSVWLIITSISLGFLLQKRIDKRNFSNHYTHYIKSDTSNFVLLKIQNKLKQTKHYQPYIANVISINNHSSFGKILIKQDVKQTKIKTGANIDLLLDEVDFMHPNKSLNPFGFDYEKYLNNKGIYHQIFLRKTAYKLIDINKSSTINIIAGRFREHIYNIFRQNGLRGKSLALATALFLGERQYISKETFTDFQSAGTIHILAISGLHVGVLLIFLNFIFGFIKRKFGNLPFLFITIFILWLYAFITGLSPSVLRAVIMFSFLQTGLQLKRETNIYNTLFSAAFLMILFDPAVIFQVGFQMSFMAVLSIVSFFPIFSKPFVNRNRLIKWFVDLFLVSLSAQIGVLPLSIYYFHQFPVYFLLANLFVIPLLFVILIYGFSVIALALLGLESKIFFIGFNVILELMLKINHKIASLEYSVIANINFNFIMLLLSFIGIFIFYSLVKTQIRFSVLSLFLVWVVFFQTYIILNSYNKYNEHNLYFLHQFKQNIIGESRGNSFVFYQNKNSINPYILKAFAQNYKHLSYTNLPVIQYFEKNKILHIDSLGIWNFNNFYPQIIAIHNSPKINLDILIEKLQPRIIIADASNYPSYVERWKKSAKKYPIKFIDINKNGAYILQAIGIEQQRQ